jgi:hypothetical protein
MVRDGRMLLIDVAFAEVRPTPWRQAVDLANMMLCLGLRSDAPRVFDRARLQFSVEEISEGFAAARGLALPSQLRMALRAEGRGLHEEFLRLLPQRPQPIKVQRWTARRMVIWAGLVMVVTLLAFNFSRLFANSEATRAPLDVATMDCAESEALEPLWIEAQSVQTSELLPCVASLPVGWSLGTVYANSGRSGFTVNHDRAGHATIEVTLTKRCDTRGATELAGAVVGARRFARPPVAGASLDDTWYDVFPGGCTTTRLRSQRTEPEVNGEVGRQGSTVVGYVTRASLAEALADRTDGRLHLDPIGRG